MWLREAVPGIWEDGRKPSVYAHVATDPACPGKLVVEYWFYYTFNDFTDKHESDWEMAQVDFDASDATEALAKGPDEVDPSQHAGGERSAWTDSKLEKQGTHPVIYDATGSHANYFASALYVGRGAREGFGCDDTRTATTRLQLQTVLLPDVPTSATAPYAWLTFAAAGAIFVPVYLVAASIQRVIFHLSAVAPLIALDGRHGAVTAFLAVLIDGIGGLFASVIATAAVAVILDEIDAGRRILAGQAYRRVLRRLRPLTRGMLTELGMALLLTITVVGIPFAIHRFIRWSLFAQACMLGDLAATESLHRTTSTSKREESLTPCRQRLK